MDAKPGEGRGGDGCAARRRDASRGHSSLMDVYPFHAGPDADKVNQAFHTCVPGIRCIGQ